MYGASARFTYDTNVNTLIERREGLVKIFKPMALVGSGLEGGTKGALENGFIICGGKKGCGMVAIKGGLCKACLHREISNVMNVLQ